MVQIFATSPPSLDIGTGSYTVSGEPHAGLFIDVERWMKFRRYLWKPRGQRVRHRQHLIRAERTNRCPRVRHLVRRPFPDVIHSFRTLPPDVLSGAESNIMRRTIPVFRGMPKFRNARKTMCQTVGDRNFQSSTKRAVSSLADTLTW